MKSTESNRKAEESEASKSGDGDSQEWDPNTDHGQKAMQFMAVPVAAVQPGSKAPANLYVKTSSGKGDLYLRAREEVESGKIESLLEQGIDSFYVQASDRSAYHEYLERNLSAIAQCADLPLEKRCEIIYQRSSRAVEELFENPGSGENINRVGRVVKATIIPLIEETDALWHMNAVAPDDYHAYTHSVNVTLFLTRGAVEILGMENRRDLERVALGAILHDIGKTRVGKDILGKPGELTDEEFEKVKEHPVEGLQIAQRNKELPEESAQIIRSHHEAYDGSGYPDGVPAEKLSPSVRLSTIVDAFEAMTTERAYGPAREAYPVLRTMMNEMNGHFDHDLLRAFVRFLGPA